MLLAGFSHHWQLSLSNDCIAFFVSLETCEPFAIPCFTLMTCHFDHILDAVVLVRSSFCKDRLSLNRVERHVVVWLVISTSLGLVLYLHCNDLWVWDAWVAGGCNTVVVTYYSDSSNGYYVLGAHVLYNCTVETLNCWTPNWFTNKAEETNEW